MFSKDFADLRCLQSEFTSGDEEEGLDLGFIDVNLLECRDNESGSLAGAVLCTGKDIAVGECDGDSFFLYWRGLFETCFKDAHEELAAEVHVFEFKTLGSCHVFCLRPGVF